MMKVLGFGMSEERAEGILSESIKFIDIDAVIVVIDALTFQMKIAASNEDFKKLEDQLKRYRVLDDIVKLVEHYRGEVEKPPQKIEASSMYGKAVEWYESLEDQRAREKKELNSTYGKMVEHIFMGALDKCQCDICKRDREKGE